MKKKKKTSRVSFPKEKIKKLRSKILLKKRREKRKKEERPIFHKLNFVRKNFKKLCSDVSFLFFCLHRGKLWKENQKIF